MSAQSKQEEIWNSLSHGFGALLGIVGLVVLIVFTDNNKDWHLFSVMVYGISTIILFLASTLYHAVSKPELKQCFRVVDHISIYLLIAGTYTPVLLILLKDSLGWPLFYTVWSIAAFGVILKLFFTGKFEILSTLLYLVMGWLIVLDYGSLSTIMHTEGLYWLMAGGMFYTVGIIFYAIHKIPYNHVIWHFFVLAGAICHFFMIFWYVI